MSRLRPVVLAGSVLIGTAVPGGTAHASSSLVAPTFALQIGQPGNAFVYPFGMAWDSTTGTILVTDYNNYDIKRFRPDGSYVATYGSKGTGPGQFVEQPSGIAVNPSDGSFVVAFAFKGYGYMKFDTSGQNPVKVNSAPAYYAPFIATNSSGEVYLVQSTGLSKSSPNVVLMFDAAGNPNGQFGTNGTNCAAGQFGVIRGIDVDSAGNVYVDDVSNHCVQVFSSTGAFEGFFGDRTHLSANTRGLTVDRLNHVVYVADAAKEDVVAYTFTMDPVTNAFQGAAFQGSVGFAGSTCGGGGELDAPRDMAVGPDGTVYVSDYACWNIDAFTPLSDATNPGQLTLQIPTPSIPAPPGGLNMSTGVAVSPLDGAVYVADTFNQRIQEFDGLNTPGGTPGAFVQQWGRRLPALDGPFALDYPRGVAVDPNTGTLWVSDTRSGFIKQYTASGSTPASATVASGTIFGGEGIQPGQFFYSDGITVGTDGNLYVPDSGIGYFQVTTQSGTVLAEFPCGTLVEPNVFNGCTSAALDPGGNVYAASFNEGVVDVFSPYVAGGSPTLLRTIGASAPGGKLAGPYGVAISGTTLYVTQSTKNEVSEFNITDGSYLGSFGVRGAAHGDFNRPLGIAVDPAGHIFVDDYGNGRVEVFTP